MNITITDANGSTFTCSTEPAASLASYWQSAVSAASWPQRYAGPIETFSSVAYIPRIVIRLARWRTGGARPRRSKVRSA